MYRDCWGLGFRRIRGLFVAILGPDGTRGWILPQCNSSSPNTILRFQEYVRRTKRPASGCYEMVAVSDVGLRALVFKFGGCVGFGSYSVAEID